MFHVNLLYSLEYAATPPRTEPTNLYSQLTVKLL